eukprot:GHVH01004499.1.p1 GENE.GHVH01004499.1~~GHVH01004499.1.p1  ORF type:complete len:463 (+),score=58.47 GHVH01004499.1:61-1449(+)
MKDKFILPYDVQKDHLYNKKANNDRDPEFEQSRLQRVRRLVSIYKLGDVGFKQASANLPKDSLLHADALSDIFSYYGSAKFSEKEFCEKYMKRRNQIADELTLFKQEQAGLKSSVSYADAQRKRSDSAGPKKGKLIVQVHSIHGTPEVDEFTKFRIHLNCKSQTIETRSARFLDNSISLNELFSFQIPEPQLGVTAAVLEVAMKDEKMQNTASVGMIQISNLSDQRVHEFDLQLSGDQPSSVKIAIQWIYDPISLHDTYAKDYKKRITALGPLIRDKQIMLRSYDRPFNNSTQGAGHMVKGAIRGDLAADKFDEFMEHYGLTNTQKASQVFVSMYLILVCFASYARCMFLDQAIALFAFFFNLEARRWSATKYRNCIIGLLIAMALDIWWISIYLYRWGGGSADVPFVHITRIFTVITFVWRIVVCLFFWKCSRDLKTRTANGIHKNRFPNKGGSVDLNKLI